MLPARRSAPRVTQRLQARTQRRFESSHNDNHGPHHHNTEPVNESLPRGLYIALAAVPLAYGIYTATAPTADSKPALTRLIEKYHSYGEDWVAANKGHTEAVQRAAYDRNLFQSSPGSRMIDLKFPEQFNVGSPYNVHAGHSADLSKLIAHYEDKNREIEERRATRQKQKEDMVVAVQKMVEEKKAAAAKKE